VHIEKNPWALNPWKPSPHLSGHQENVRELLSWVITGEVGHLYHLSQGHSLHHCGFLI
jgi:hypothetical protein